MKAIFKSELKRAFINRAFLLSLLVGIGICICHIIFVVIPFADAFDARHLNALASPGSRYPGSLYGIWIGGNTGGLPGASVYVNLYFFILPLLVCIPFVGSYFSDRTGGYAAQQITRVGASKYYTSKLLAIFLSGASVVVLPLMLNFFVTAAFVPAILPVLSISQFLGTSSMWGVIFYQTPLVYYLMYLGLIALFSGLFAALGAASSYFVKHQAFSLVIPFAVVAFLSFFFRAMGGFWIRYDPVYFLRPDQPVHQDGISIVVALVVLVVGLFVFFLFKIRKDEIY